MGSIFDSRMWMDSEVYINPENDMRSQGVDLGKVYLGDTCIFVFSYNIYKKILNEVKIDFDFKWPYKTTELHRCISEKGTIYSLCFPSYGGTRVASSLETISSIGINHVIGLGLGGTPQESISVGDVIVVEGSVRGDGVSRYYVPIEFPAVADMGISLKLMSVLKSRNFQFQTGLSFGIDALYRESKQLVEYLREMNVLVVDLESSSLLTVGRRLGIKCSWVGVVSDRLVGDKHEFCAHSEHIEDKLLKIGRSVIAMVDEI